MPGRGGDPQAWPAVLRGPNPARDEARAALGALLLRGARFELRRRRDTLDDVTDAELESLAIRAAERAMQQILANLDSFRAHSRFSTWASKFVLFEAGVSARRRAWRDRDGACARVFDDRPETQAIRRALETALTPDEREVIVALCVDGVPIDVLAGRRGTTRGALYRTLHDGRSKLRAALPGALSEPGASSDAHDGGDTSEAGRVRRRRARASPPPGRAA